MTIHLILQVVALILLVLAAFGVPSSRVSLGWLGMAVWLLSILITTGGVVLR